VNDKKYNPYPLISLVLIVLLALMTIKLILGIWWNSTKDPITRGL